MYLYVGFNGDYRALIIFVRILHISYYDYYLLYGYYYFRHQCMLVAGLSKQTIALQDDELHFAHIRIQSCRHSYIYIVAPVRYNDSSTSTVYLYKC